MNVSQDHISDVQGKAKAEEVTEEAKLIEL